MKIGYVANIEKQTVANENFRKVVYTGQHEQVVLMSLKQGEEIGMEVHEITDQFLRIEQGSGYVVIDGEKHDISDGSAIVVPAGARHNVVNTGEQSMKLYTVYSPPHHKKNAEYKTKKEAESDETDHI